MMPRAERLQIGIDPTYPVQDMYVPLSEEELRASWGLMLKNYLAAIPKVPKHQDDDDVDYPPAM